MMRRINSGHAADYAGNIRTKHVQTMKVAAWLCAAVCVMSACAGGRGGAAGRAGGVRGAVGDSSSAAERVERRLGPVERVEVLVLPPGTVIGGGGRAAGSEGGAR